jgi:hypothetical protein
MSYTISAGFAVNQAIFAAVVRGGTDTSSVVAAFINGDANNHLRIVAQSSSRYDFFKRLLAYSSLGSQQGWGISSAGDFATAEPLAAIAINGSNDETSVGYANGSERTGLTYTTAQMTSAFPLGTSVRLDACGGLATKTYAWGAASAAPSSGEITELNALLAAKCGATLV